MTWQMACNLLTGFAASATHYVPEILLQVCLKLIFWILFIKIRLSVAKSDSMSQDYTAWPILSLALHIWFHNCVWRMLCLWACFKKTHWQNLHKLVWKQEMSNSLKMTNLRNLQKLAHCVWRDCASRLASEHSQLWSEYWCTLVAFSTYVQNVSTSDSSVLSGIMWS